jgi:hypothetical protein
MARENLNEPANDRLLDRLLERMLFSSDAVFAIVLTLLAHLHLPRGTDDAHLVAGIEAVRGPLIAFAVSFGLVGFFWLVHVISLRTLATFDWLVAAANVGEGVLSDRCPTAGSFRTLLTRHHRALERAAEQADASRSCARSIPFPTGIGRRRHRGSRPHPMTLHGSSD